MRVRFSTRSLPSVFCSIILAALPAFASPTVAGDVDSSGAVDAIDVQLVINAALGIPVPGAAKTDIDYDSERATTAVDLQLVINAADGITIDSDGNGIADLAEDNLRTQLRDALQLFANADVSPTEAADTLFTAVQSLASAVGHDQAQTVLRAVQVDYINAGGTLAGLAAKSSQIPPLAFTPGALTKRRAERAAAKALGIPESAVAQPTYSPEDTQAKASAYRNTVIYVNGIWTQFADFASDSEAVKSAIGDLIEPYAIKYAPIWNPTAGFYDLIPQCANQKILEWIQQSVNVPDFNPTSLWIGEVVGGEANAGRNVVLLPHSQGNFHVRQALNDLTLAERASVNVIELASPVKTMPTGLRNLTRVDIVGDLVPELSGATIDPLPYDGVWGLGDWIHALFPSPHFDPLGIILLDHHDLKGAYLKGKAKETILADLAKFCITP